MLLELAVCQPGTGFCHDKTVADLIMEDEVEECIPKAIKE